MAQTTRPELRTTSIERGRPITHGELPISQRLGGEGTAAVRPTASEPASSRYGVKAIANTASVALGLQYGGEVRHPPPDLHLLDREAHRTTHRAVAGPCGRVSGALQLLDLHDGFC